MKIYIALGSFFIAALIFVSQSAIAEPFTIGAGVHYRDEPYSKYDSDEETQFLPLILYEGEHFFVRGDTLGWNFANSDVWEYAIIGQYLDYGYDSSDSNVLNGMGDRDPSFGVGGHVIWKPEKLGLKFSAVTDVADESEGSQVVGEIFYRHETGTGLTLKPYASIVWQDEDFNDYYYGVRGREATLARPAYEADDDINFRLGLEAGYRKPGSNWLFTGGVQYEYLGDEIDDSPITSDDKVLSALIGVGYTFGN